MQLTGSHTLPASTATVWQMLMDTDILARIVPGITHLEKTGENQYNAIAEIKMGPVNGSFSGGLTLQDIREEEGYSLHVTQNSKIGNADATIKIEIKALAPNQTELSFDGDAKISGVLARMGQRVLGSVSNTLTKQFFDNFEEEIAKQPSRLEPVIESVAEKVAEGLPTTATKESWFMAIMNFFKRLFG